MTKGAIIVGISDYKNISDLSYCDEDATNWYNYLNTKGYECKVFGDRHEGNYPRYDGLATEDNVRCALRELLSIHKTVAFVTSGHGSGNGTGDSHLCMYNIPRGDEKYTDKELLSDIKAASRNTKIFVFIDHCYSGGMLDDLADLPNVFATSTCSDRGYGYDDYRSKSGAYTNQFLTKGLKGIFKDGKTPLRHVFNWSRVKYKHKAAKDTPQMMCGSNMTSFVL